MVFQNLERLAEFVNNDTKATARMRNNKEKDVIYLEIVDLRELSGIVASELMINIYDSRFIIGGFFANEVNGYVQIEKNS